MCFGISSAETFFGQRPSPTGVDLISAHASRSLLWSAWPRRARPQWSSILPLMVGALWLVEHAAGRNETSLLVEARKLVGDFLADQAQLGQVWSAPAFESSPVFSQWLAQEIDLVAAGTSLWLDEPVVAMSRFWRRRGQPAGGRLQR